MKFIQSLLFLGLVLLLNACTDQSPENAQQLGNTIVSQILSEPQSLHPTNGISGSRSNILYFTNQSLTRIDPEKLELVPLLAEKLPRISANGLKYTYRLHPDAAWDDGTPMTAEDVLFSLKVVKCPLLENKAGSSLYQIIKDARLYAKDDRKITFEMRKKYVNNLYLTNSFFILDRRKFDPKGLLENFTLEQFGNPDSTLLADPNLVKWANEFNDPKYGRNVKYLFGTSGPYKVTDWVPEQQIVLSRRKNYWGKNLEGPAHSQYPEKIIFKKLTDEKSLELEIKQQKVDVAPYLNSPTYDNLINSETATENYYLGFKEKDGYSYIGYNTRPDGITHPLVLNDKQVRRALAYAIPLDDIIQQYYNGRASRIFSPVSPFHPDYNRNLNPIPFNLDSASAILTRSGWTDQNGDQVREKELNGENVPLKITLSYPANSTTIENIVFRIKTEVAKVGIEVIQEPLDFNLLVSKVTNHDYEACLLGSSSPLIPYDFIQNWSSDGWTAGTNLTGFSTPETDSLMKMARVELDTEVRKEMVDRIQEIIYDEQPAFFLYNRTNHIAIHKRYENAGMFQIMPYVLLNNLKARETVTADVN
ncbi:MAG: ABC transporter substrate-binding protein [Bacteroidota bacterium]